MKKQSNMKLKLAAVAAGANQPLGQKSYVPESTWEEIESIYQTCAKGIVDIANFVNSTRSEFINAQVKEIPTGVTTAIVGLTKDIDTLTNSLCNIHDKHKGLTGKITSDTDHANSVRIVSDYVEFKERFEVATLTPMQVISEGLYEVKLNQAKAQAH